MQKERQLVVLEEHIKALLILCEKVACKDRYQPSEALIGRFWSKLPISIFAPLSRPTQVLRQVSELAR